MAVRKLKPVEANEGSYGGRVLAAFDAIERSELDKLAHSLAYESAESIISSESLPYYDQDEQRWFEVEPEGEVELVDALRYLELRGLLERHPENANRVQVRDESEATA